MKIIKQTYTYFTKIKHDYAEHPIHNMGLRLRLNTLILWLQRIKKNGYQLKKKCVECQAADAPLISLMYTLYKVL
jgi:hypothetical protein